MKIEKKIATNKIKKKEKGKEKTAESSIRFLFFFENNLERIYTHY